MCFSLLLSRLSYLCISITTSDPSLDLLTIQKDFFYDGFVGAAESNRKQCFSRTFDVNIAVSVRRPIRFYELPSRTPRSPHLHGSSVLFTPSTQNFRKEMPQSTAGAGNGIRTRMVSPPADFKSAASTDLTIPADQ